MFATSGEKKNGTKSSERDRFKTEPITTDFLALPDGPLYINKQADLYRSVKHDPKWAVKLCTFPDKSQRWRTG